MFFKVKFSNSSLHWKVQIAWIEKVGFTLTGREQLNYIEMENFSEENELVVFVIN